MKAKDVYELFRQMQSEHFAKSTLAPWESLGMKHKIFWTLFADALEAGFTK